MLLLLGKVGKVTMLMTGVAEDRLRLNNARKINFFLSLCSTCTMLTTGVVEDRRRLGNAQKNLAFRSICTIFVG
jgi:hypothetical protein